VSDPTKSPLEMSDEEFLNQPEPVGEPIPVPEVEDAPAPAAVETEAAPEVVETPAAEATPEAAAEGETPAVEAPAAPATAEVPAEPEAPATATVPATPETPAAPEVKAEGEAAPEVKPEEKAETEAPKVFSVPTVIRANGKDITLKNEQEALTLMQMGANYTRKLQELAPHRRIMTMLENNGLLDENKLSYLIDLDKKNPEAVKKLIKDAGIDPLDVDTSADSNYVATDHTVTDAEVSFRTVIEEVASSTAGQETLTLINQWDQGSKDLLWAEPQVMSAIHEQRQNGLYDQVAAEVDRQRTLGTIPATMPFLKAYTEIGNEMARRALEAAQEAQPAPQPAVTSAPAEPVAVRVATPKSPIANGDQASAASPTRAAPAAAKVVSNPLNMSDEEFIKLNNINV
jgi:hypothetical protein